MTTGIGISKDPREAWRYFRQLDYRDQNLIYHHRPTDDNIMNSVSWAIKNSAHAINLMTALVKRVEAGKPLYVRINSGSRAGTIAKLSPSCYYVRQMSGIPDGFRVERGAKVVQGVLKTDPRFHVLIMQDLDWQGVPQNRWDHWVGFEKAVALHRTGEGIIYDFDDRKSVKTNYKDQEYLEWLPDYEGPTVYQFVKKDSMSAEQKERLKRENVLPLVPIDMFGYELEVGDKLIYARADELLFGELVKTSDKGTMTIRTFIDRREVRLQGTGLIKALMNGLPCQSFMTFDKDTNLATKLMMEKLSKA